MSARIRSAGPWLVSISAVMIALELPASAARLVRSVDIRDNTVASRDIRNDSIVGRDVRDGRLDGRDIRDGSIGQRDLAKGLIPTAVTGATGPAGATGATGATGAPGPPGTPGPVGPTFGQILDTGDVSTFPDPPFDAILASRTVQLPAAGKLMVFGSWDALVTSNCANVDFALTVDGVALSGSNHRASFPFGDEATTVIGMTADAVAAGAHTVRLVAACDPNGGNQMVSLPSARLGAVLLGS